ncbi:MAG: hypothetical protein ACTHJ3_15600 [Pararhizobium sp.]
MSCQTRHQVERFANGPTARAAGITFASGLFDWLGTPPRRNARFLDDGLPVFEVGSVIDRKGRAFLSSPGFHAFHAFRVKEPTGKRLDIAATFERELEKFRYQREKFLATDVSRTWFVLGNAQNNLVGEVYGPEEKDEYLFDVDKIDALQGALDRLFGRPCHLIVVARSDRFVGDASRDGRIRLVPPEDSEWKGDDGAWDRALSDLLEISRVPGDSVPA